MGNVVPNPIQTEWKINVLFYHSDIVTVKRLHGYPMQEVHLAFFISVKENNHYWKGTKKTTQSCHFLQEALPAVQIFSPHTLKGTIKHQTKMNHYKTRSYGFTNLRHSADCIFALK